MHKYYCKNCNNIIGKWNNKNKWYDYSKFCYLIESKNINSPCFLNCRKCDKFIGILCYGVCENCFGENEIIGEEKLFNWFQKYKKIITSCLNICKICDNKYDFRCQIWYFKELTFQNIKYKKFNILKKTLFNFFIC